MIGLVFLIVGVIAGLIGLCSDPDSEFLGFVFIIAMVLLVAGVILMAIQYNLQSLVVK